jgi:hypothetical protein
VRKIIIVIMAVAVGGCGATKYVTQTQTSSTTVTSTTTHNVTHIRRISSIPPVTTTQTTTTTITTAPTPTASFSGNGGKNIGTFHVSSASTVHWTCDGQVFQILDVNDGFTINSQGSSGTSQLQPGTYHNVDVNAIGNWTMQIVPTGG